MANAALGSTFGTRTSVSEQQCRSCAPRPETDLCDSGVTMGIADHNSERRLSARMLHEPTRALAVSQDSDGSTLPATRSARTAAHLQRLRVAWTVIELSSQDH